MGEVNSFVPNMSSFRGNRKNILGLIRKWSSEGALNFEFYLSDWQSRLALFTAVLISNTASDGNLTPPILPGGKKSRSTPAFKLTFDQSVFIRVIFFITRF